MKAVRGTLVGNNAMLDRRLIQRKCRLKCPIVSTLCASGVVLETSEGNRSCTPLEARGERRLNQGENKRADFGSIDSIALVSILCASRLWLAV